jgi:hypothetical protein
VDPIAEQLIARLRTDPTDSAAYEGLRAHYQLTGDWASLANLLEGWAEANANDWENASQAYAEAAEATLYGGGDRARAKSLFRLALQTNVLHAEAGSKLLALVDEDGDPQEQVELLDAYARALDTAGAAPDYVAGLYQRVAELWEQAFQRPDVAAQFRERASELLGAPGPEAPAAASSSAEPLQSAVDLEQRAAAELDPASKAALLSELAELRAGTLGDLEGAISALRQALTAAPGDIAVMHQLATCLLARAETADEQAARTDHRRVAELFYQIAQGVEETQALPYLESALAAMPDHDGALALLERLAPEQGQADILPGYWVSFVAAAGNGPEADQRRLALAQAYLQLGQLDDAVYCLQPAAEHGNAKAHELLQQAYGRQARAAKPQTDSDEGRAHEDEAVRPSSARSAARREDAERSQKSAEVVALRKQVHEAVTARRHDDAAQHCRAILEIDPSDPEAFNLLESHYRKRRDYPSLRDLLLASTRMPGLAVDARKMRLREVATLSEAKLRDAEGATSGWRGVVTLDPADREATANLKRLLKKAQQWEELTTVLQREALSTTGLEDKVALIREIALIHRDKRKDPLETAEAFRQLNALKPDDVAVRDELCDLLLSLEQWADATPLLRHRIEASKDDLEKHKWSAQLAAVLHEQLHDLEGAYEVCEQMLKWKPNERTTFDRMERIDQEGENYPRLLATLERRASLAAKAERPALFTRMGTIAEEQLRDLDKAAEYFGDALDLAPDNQEALQRLVDMFERASRYDELVELLRERTLLEREAKNRAPLHRRIAQVLAERLDDEAGAAEAYRKLLEIEEDEDALRFLRGVATRHDDSRELADVLRRLAARTEVVEERRDLLFDLAVLLHEKMADAGAHEAAVALKRIVTELDPAFEPAVELLATISEQISDKAGLALALERSVALELDPRARLSLAKRLADLCEHELSDSARAIAALQAWARDEAQNPEPLRRLRKLLQNAERWPELLVTLDALAEWEDDFDDRDEATIAAGRLAFERMQDAQGAWKRLLPLVEERNEQAEQALREVALRAGLQRDLAALYIKLAQETEDPVLMATRWGNAADVFEQELDDPAQALEASLRMLATDLGNRKLLVHVDRLAVKTKAFKRLSQVYDRLLKQAQDDAEKVELLQRHANLLQEEQQDEALDRILRACALAPQDEKLLVRAEDLAQRARRSEELLLVYDRRRARTDDEPGQVRLLLRAARLCDGALRDRDRANQYLKSALAVAGTSSELGLEVEATARDLDAQRPELGADGVRRTLVRSHREVAERAEPAAAVRLVLRAAELLAGELDDERAAFDLLRQALVLQPKSDEIYAALTAMAGKQKRLDSVDAHLSRLIDEAIDSATTVALLRRRGELLEGPLNRLQDAAAVYSKLLQLRPDDAEAAAKLRASLRHSGRHQDLLLALNKQLQRTRDAESRVVLLKEIALTWEKDLKNRWEALDAWKAVTREAAHDADAAAAVQRLERARTRTDDDEDAAHEESSVETSEASETIEAQPGAEPAPVEQRARRDEDEQQDDREHDSALEAEPAAASAERLAPSEPGLAPEAGSADAASLKDAVHEHDRALEPGLESAPATASEDRSPPTDPEPAAEAVSTDAASLKQAEHEHERGVQAMAKSASEPQVALPAFEETEADLDALDAALNASSAAIEEFDLLDAVEDVAVDVIVDDAAPARPSTMPPPPPIAAAQRSATPALPPIPTAPPLPPPAVRRGAPPPLPARASRPTPEPAEPTRSSSPDASTAPRSGSVPPPLPPLPPRASSTPPPLPSTRGNSQPPPLPSQRK